eukprot:764466-Hanusia_phi.AAC.1
MILQVYDAAVGRRLKPKVTVVAHRVSGRSGTRWASASLPGPRPGDPVSPGHDPTAGHPITESPGYAAPA